MSSRSDMNKMGKHIAELRKKKGYTQKKLGDLLDVSDKTISKWEKGIVAPDITVLNLLASTLDITVEELLLGEEKKELNTIDAINVYSKLTKRKLLKIFIVIIFILLLCSFFIFRIEDYYSWHVTPIYSEGIISSSGYILNNNKESKIVINKFIANALSESEIDVNNITNIKSTVRYEDNTIYEGELILNDNLDYHSNFDSYVIFLEHKGVIEKEKLNIEIIIKDKNSSVKLVEINYK